MVTAVGLRVFDREAKWSEVFHDSDYGSVSYGVTFADDGRLATSAYDGKIRLYDRSFSFVASQDALSGHRPARIAFSPDGAELAIGYSDKPSVDFLDGH